MMLRRIAVLAGAIFCAYSLVATAADPAAPATPAAPAAAAAAKAPAKPFPEQLAVFEALNKKLIDQVAVIRAAPPTERTKLIGAYMTLVDEMEKFLPDFFAAAQTAYEAAPNKDEKVTDVVLDSIGWLEGHDDYEAATKVIKLLEAKGCPRPELHELAGMAAFVNNDFTTAGVQLKAARAALKEGEGLSPQAENFADSVEEYKKLWTRENDLRTKEAAAADLPQVKVETTKGTLVIELFENEAPQTVANFVSLVEKKFYDGLPFHRVLPGFMAQGGDPAGNGTGGPGYSIYCECAKPEQRAHFRGTLSMAHAGKDTGGSQFFLTFVPTPFLNGKHTVFGRVVDGFDVLAKLERIDPERPDPRSKPDKIVKATVVRKRNHEYVPTKVSEK